MPYDGNGNFLPIPAPVFPAVPGEVIYSDYFNQTLRNVHDGLSAALPRDGQAGMTGNLNMGGNNLANLIAGVTPGNAVEWQQWRDSFYAPAFGQPTAGTPPATADDTRIANTAWVRLILASATINVPPILGQSGQLTTDGTSIFWRSGVPDYLLNAAGVF